MRLSVLFLFSSIVRAGIAPGLWFEPNQGQAHPSVQFVARTSQGYVYLGWNQMAVQVQGKPVRMTLEGANGVAVASLEEPLGAISSYFSGQDEKNWHTGIPHYARVHYKEVYPGIDIVYYANGRDLEYDFRLQADADPTAIRLTYNEPVRSDANGDLLIAGLRQKKPKVHQNGKEVACDYLVHDAHHVQLTLAAYDRSRSLTVDPELVFSTYLGGPGNDSADGIALDSSGFIYLGMSTQSPASPILDPFQQETVSVSQPAIFKFSPDGQRLVYYAVLNSGAWDSALNVTVDSNGSPIVVGLTRSANFPLKNPVQSMFNASIWTGFITKLTPDSRSLVYSTYFGGSNRETVNGVVVDKQGNAYFTGGTYSRDIPTKNAIQPQYGGGSDCFIGKLSPTGNLIFSTYYGGSGTEFCSAITLASDGGVTIAGASSSADFPFKNPIQTEFTQRPLWQTPTLVKLSADGQTVVFATYFGGPTAGGAEAVSVDALGNIYTAGYVEDNLFTAKNGYQSTYPGAPCPFLAKFDSTMQKLIYATYFGGSSGGATEAFGVAVDSNGSAYIAGKATSADFPQKNSLQTFLGGGPDNADAFVAKFDPSGSTLIYSTLLGGHNEDGLGQIALDPKGDVYAAGVTVSSDFPVENAFQPTYGGGGDGVLLELSDNTPLSPSPLTITPGRVTFQFVQGGSAPAAQTVAVTGPSFTPSASASWIAVATQASAALSISVNPMGLAPGTYNSAVTLTPQAGTPATVDVVLTVLAPAPVLTSITPALVAIGSNATTIMIHGSGFTAQSVLLILGQAWQQTPLTLLDSGTLQITLPSQLFSAQATWPLSVQNPQSAVSNVLSLTVGPIGPQFTASSVVNAASFAAGPVAPGEIISIFGASLVENVSFDNTPVTPFYFSATQVNVTVPYFVAGAATILQMGASLIQLQVAPAAPGIFAAVSAGDGIVVLYATGCGALTTDALPRCMLPVSVTVNGEPATVLYAGIAPGLVQGANQVNIQLPPDITSGQVTIVLTAGDASSTPFSFTLP